MNDSEASGEALFFGGLEAICFGGLFLSPLLTPQAFFWLWPLVALTRLVAGLTLVAFRRGARLKSLAGLLGRGWLYQIPFWTSALFFPVAAGQQELALWALAIQVVLQTLLLPLVNGVGWLYLPLLYYISWGWLFGPEVAEKGLEKVALVGLLVGLLTFLFSWSDQTVWSRLRGRRPVQALALAVLWLCSVGLLPLQPQVVGSTALRATVLPWCLVALLGSAVFAAGRRLFAAQASREVELTVPAGWAAVEWSLRRRFRWSLVTFLPFAGLVIELGMPTLVCLVLLVTAWDRAVVLVARGRVRQEALAWWAVWEFFLLWGAARTDLAAVTFWLVPALLASALVRLGAPVRPRLSTMALGELEQRLRQGLRVRAPDGFAADVMARVEPSVDLDEKLNAAAPAGFGKRLLERLKAQSVPADEEDGN